MNNLIFVYVTHFLMQVKDGTEKVTTDSWLKATAMWKHYLAVPARKWYRENLHVYFYHHQPVFNCNIFHHVAKVGHWTLLRLNDSNCKENSKPGLPTLWPETHYHLATLLFGMSLTAYQLNYVTTPPSICHCVSPWTYHYVSTSIYHSVSPSICHCVSISICHCVCHLEHVTMDQLQYVIVCHLQYVIVYQFQCHCVSPSACPCVTLIVSQTFSTSLCVASYLDIKEKCKYTAECYKTS